MFRFPFSVPYQSSFPDSLCGGGAEMSCVAGAFALSSGTLIGRTMAVQSPQAVWQIPFTRSMLLGTLKDTCLQVMFLKAEEGTIACVPTESSCVWRFVLLTCESVCEARHRKLLLHNLLVEP